MKLKARRTGKRACASEGGVLVVVVQETPFEVLHWLKEGIATI